MGTQFKCCASSRIGKTQISCKNSYLLFFAIAVNEKLSRGFPKLFFSFSVSTLFFSFKTLGLPHLSFPSFPVFDLSVGTGPFPVTKRNDNTVKTLNQTLFYFSFFPVSTLVAETEATNCGEDGEEQTLLSFFDSCFFPFFPKLSGDKYRVKTQKTSRDQLRGFRSTQR